MNPTKEVAKIMAEKYEQQEQEGTEIVLIKNSGNDGGHCENRELKKDIIYKIIFPVPLRSLNHCIDVSVSINKNGKFVKMLTVQEQNTILTIYDEYSVDFCFFKFSKDFECSFFTNI
jgi:hypothetical protein